MRTRRPRLARRAQPAVPVPISALAVGPVELGVDGKAAGAALARHVAIGRAAQPAPGRQQGDGFQQIGLAGAVLAGEARPRRARGRATALA